LYSLLLIFLSLFELQPIILLPSSPIALFHYILPALQVVSGVAALQVFPEVVSLPVI
jgi:hypothetical protein